MNRFAKANRNLRKSQSKSLAKSSGVSSNKMTSIFFLLATIFIALALSGVAFLVSRTTATMPKISEGMEDMSGNNTMEGFKESVNTPTSNVSGTTNQPAMGGSTATSSSGAPVASMGGSGAPSTASVAPSSMSGPSGVGASSSPSSGKTGTTGATGSSGKA